MKITAPASGALPKTPLVVLLAVAGKKPALPPGCVVPAAFLDSFDGALRAVSSTFTTGGLAQRALAVGLGPQGGVDAEGLRRAGAIAARQAEALGAAKASLWVDRSWSELAGGGEVVGRALAEGSAMGSWRFDAKKSAPTPPKCKALELVGGSAAFRRGARKGSLLAAANLFVRDLQVRPANDVTPAALARAARKLAERSERIRCRVIEEREMKALGMGLLLSVSQGSTQPAKLIHLTYRPRRAARSKVCLVGKGLTFDVGGLSIKPSAKLDEMRYDMSGGAAVLGVFHALAGIDVPHEVHGLVPASENLIDGGATKPGDVHAAMNGKTVEILNTDAEGRLILADAMCYAEKKIRPDVLIDIATLTGAVVTALGHELSAIYPSNAALRDALVAAGAAVGEACWPMPLLDVHRDAVKGQMADLANISSPAVGAGSVTAAAFLSYFVPSGSDWCHMDIAGTAWGAAPRDWVGGPQGTGVGTRLLMEYLETRR